MRVGGRILASLHVPLSSAPVRHPHIAADEEPRPLTKIQILPPRAKGQGPKAQGAPFSGFYCPEPEPEGT